MEDTALEVGQRHLGRGRFFAADSLSVPPGLNNHAVIASPEEYEQTPRTVQSVEVASAYATLAYSSNMGLSDGTDSTASDSTISTTDPHLYQPRNRSLSESESSDADSFFSDSASTVGHNGSGFQVDPSNYTTSVRYQFGEFPIACVFEFSGCPERHLGTQQDKWKSCANSHLRSQEFPTELLCTYGGCNTEIEHWDSFLDHLFGVHGKNTETVIELFTPGPRLLEYCRKHEILDSDQYSACLLRFGYLETEAE